MLGLYLHVPFCVSKCPYCDFYSLKATEETMDAYVRELCRRLSLLPASTRADTLYFGGGTPSLLGAARLIALMEAAQPFLTAQAEITLEANPAESLYDTFAAFKAAGGNRLSMGMQAATAEGLSLLGRRHTPASLRQAVSDAHRAGLDNLSLDLMLGTPRQTQADVDLAVKTCLESDAKHVSAYLLKLEEGTPFFETQDALSLPDEEDTASLYLYTCDALEQAGYRQYEISNYAKDGFQSRHNLKYWNSEEYLGLGPSAHSFQDGKRVFFPRSLEAFMQGGEPLCEDPDAEMADASQEEYMMLRLRLTDGIDRRLFEKRFGTPLPAAVDRAAEQLPPSLVIRDDRRIALTREGFLVSNTLIARLLWGNEDF